RRRACRCERRSRPRSSDGFLRSARGDEAPRLVLIAARFREDLAGVLTEERTGAFDARARRAETDRCAERAHGPEPRVLEVDEEVTRQQVWIVEHRRVVLDLDAGYPGRSQR